MMARGPRGAPRNRVSFTTLFPISEHDRNISIRQRTCNPCAGQSRLRVRLHSSPWRGGREGVRGSGDGGRGRTIPDYPGLSRTIPDGEGGREGSGGAPGTSQAIGKTRVPETGPDPGEVEQGGRGRLPARCGEPPQAVEANGRGDRRSMTRSFPLAPTIRPRARRVKRSRRVGQGDRSRDSVFTPPPGRGEERPLEGGRSEGAERGVGVLPPGRRKISRCDCPGGSTGLAGRTGAATARAARRFPASPRRSGRRGRSS